MLSSKLVQLLTAIIIEPLLGFGEIRLRTLLAKFIPPVDISAITQVALVVWRCRVRIARKQPTTGMAECCGKGLAIFWH